MNRPVVVGLQDHQRGLGARALGQLHGARDDAAVAFGELRQESQVLGHGLRVGADEARGLEVVHAAVALDHEVAVGAAHGVAAGLAGDGAHHVVVERPDGVLASEEQEHDAVGDAEAVVRPHERVAVVEEGFLDRRLDALLGEHLLVAFHELVARRQHAGRHEIEVGAQEPADDAPRAALEQAVWRDQRVSQLLGHPRSP